MLFFCLDISITEFRISDFGFRIFRPHTHVANTNTQTHHDATHPPGSRDGCPTKGKRIRVVLWCGRPGRTCRRDARTSLPLPGVPSRRAGGAEGLVARAARRGQLVRVSVPDGRVSRAAAEVRSGSGRGGEAAAPTSGVTGLNQAPRNRSEAEIPRSRRDWASGCVSPTGATEG